MYKIPLNTGTLAGIVSFALFLILYYAGFSPLSLGKFLGFWIPIAAVIWAVLQVRTKVLGGTMTYMQGFLSGMVTMLIWCSFKGFAMYIFMTVVENHVIDQYISFSEKYIELSEDITGETMKNKEALQKVMHELTPWKAMLGDINSNALYGSFIVFIVAFVTKRVPKS